ncbi:MAG: hypothetical protein JO112_01355, partial [Planctomycetes bacterium]|nr:hypothetical protein [Planctomycetota bacterium]
MSDIIHQGNETSNGTPLPPAVVYHGGEPGATLPAVREGLVPYPPSGGPDITSILQALRRRWFLALSLGLLAASLVAVAAWFGLHPSYTVSAQVDIAAKKPRTLTPTGDAYESDVEYSTYKQTQVMRIKSRPVLNAAVTRPEVKDLHLFNAGSDPAASLESGLKIDAHEGSEIVGISLNGPNPDQLLVLVNAVTHAYLEDTAQSERRRQLDRIAELDKLAAQSGGQLRGQQETWHQLADQLGTSDPQAMIQKQLSLQSALDNLRKEQTELDFSQRRLQAQRAAAEVKARLAGQLELPAALVNAALDADPSAKYYYARLVKLKEILADYEQNARNSDEPSLVRARQETADTEKALADRRTALQAQLQEEVRQKTRLELEAQVAQLQSEEASGATREQTVTAEINRLVKELERVGTLTTKFRLLDDKIKDGEGQAKKMVDEANGLKIELQTPPRISLYQEAAI